MCYICRYESPIGSMTLAARDEGLAGAWFDGQKYDRQTLGGEVREDPDHPILLEACRWLDGYFAGQPAAAMPRLCLSGSPFRQLVAEEMLAIPYGRTTTYARIAASVACRMGKAHMSAQAVGCAVGHNALSIFVPCHRVLGADGSLTGYAGGLERKEWLLRHEGIILL